MTRAPRQRAHRVPKQFMCPISQEFMKEPVIVPSSQRTIDYKSHISHRINNNLPQEDENEMLMPDFDLRWQNSAWLHRYHRRHPFEYISTFTGLERAVTSLITRQQNDILEDSDFLDNLRQLNSAIEGKITLINSAMGYSLLLRLILGCPVSSDNEAEWVRFSVGILARASDIDNENPFLYANYRRPVLAVIDRVCLHIHDTNFQVGLVNLIDSFIDFEGSEQIITSHAGVIEALSSYILEPSHQRFATSKGKFLKLLRVISLLWETHDGIKKPRLSQAVAALVWPFHQQMYSVSYHNLLRSISSILQWQDDLADSVPHGYIEGSLELMTRAGLVYRVFKVLEYATQPENDKLYDLDGWFASGAITSRTEEDFVIQRCFQILWSVSSVTIGRLEIVRVISSSGYTLLEAFYKALSRTAHAAQRDSHVVPALSVLLNVLENSRYTQLFERAEGPGFQEFLNLDFQNCNHQRVRTIARKLFASLARIQREERDPPLLIY